VVGKTVLEISEASRSLLRDVSEIAAKPMLLSSNKLRQGSYIHPVKVRQCILAKTNEEFICKS
jgi:hypothetical protein